MLLDAAHIHHGDAIGDGVSLALIMGDVNGADSARSLIMLPQFKRQLIAQAAHPGIAERFVQHQAGCGFGARLRARATRCFWPPESDATSRAPMLVQAHPLHQRRAL